MKTYPLFKVHVPTEQALAQLRKVFESGFINEGTQVTELTNALKDVLSAENLILTNSCTSALTLALKLAGVGPGDEVITTPMTCVATNTPIANLGAKLVWADIDPETGMIDPQQIAAKITDKTKAVTAVAWAGTPPNLWMLKKACTAFNVKLILDAAHAFDAQYEGAPMHEWADYTCYSFQAIKHFTTGDGGALVCADDADYARSKALKWFGLDRDKTKDEKGNWKGQQWDTDVEEAGYKFNMNNVSAAIGLSQIDHIPHILGTHRCNAVLYEELFSDFKQVRPLRRSSGNESSFWVYGMKVDPERSRLSRDELLKALNAEGIMAGLVHVPNDTYTAFKDSTADLPGVREFSANQFSLPCGWWLTDDDVRHIAKRVKELTR
jgi:dTDP-4-amino-4,6-dideoxygalactose transaminase